MHMELDTRDEIRELTIEELNRGGSGMRQPTDR